MGSVGWQKIYDNTTFDGSFNCVRVIVGRVAVKQQKKGTACRGISQELFLEPVMEQIGVLIWRYGAA